MDFKDQFVGINVSNFSPGCIEKKIDDTKFLEKKKAVAIKFC